jgi:dethiobiotin synthetase|tara:strand:+ start:11997 stop:12614 length:618 start_codon:yes stop_codon:yes gene_type:complete
MRKVLVIAGISTEVGKTVASALFTEALKADYWKPVQSGSLRDSDTERVRDLVSHQNAAFHKESYLLKEPLSPHAAAELEGIHIDLEHIIVPETDENLIIEMAGGLMVPLNEKDLTLDLLKKWKYPVVLVSNFYLGSINHTLMSVDILRLHSVPIHSIVFNGIVTPSSRDAIVRHAQVNRYYEMPTFTPLDKKSIKAYAQQIATSI